MIGSKIRSIRKNKGISQKELSRKSGISISYIQQLEYEIKENPSLDILTSIANALDVKLTELTEEYDVIRNGNNSKSFHGRVPFPGDFSEENIKNELSKIILGVSESTEKGILDKDMLKYLADETYNYIKYLLYKH